MITSLRIFTVALAAVACMSVSRADTIVRMTGSTAFRANVHQAIRDVYDSGYTFGYTGATIGGANQAIFHGTIGGAGNPVTIKTSWTGSEGGIQTVAGSVAIPFLGDATPTSTGGTGGATAGGDNSVPDVAMSDSFQSSSAFFGLFRGVTYPTLTESSNSPVGIVPFKFLANKGAPATLTNITFEQAQALFGAGTLPLAFFTGNAADESKTIVATGRDPDSGTRVTAMADVELGPQASVKHWQPLDASNNPVITVGTDIAKFRPWPASTINGIPVAVFNGGFSSGGDLTKMMANVCPAGFTIVSYAGTNDADTNALPNGAVELQYDGVLLGNTGGNYNNSAVLTEGKYGFWGYEHMYYRSGTPSPVATIADTVANQLKTADSPVFVGSMKSSRATDGSVILPTYSTVPPPQ